MSLTRSCCSGDSTDCAVLLCAACHSRDAHGQPCSSLSRPGMFPGGNFIVQMRVADTVQDARCMRLRDGVRMVIDSKSVGFLG